MNTVLITGSSLGIGLQTALLFAEKGWNVAATMRTVEKVPQLANKPNVALTALDVTDRNSIAAAVAETIARFGKIDVIVNNAGYGLKGPFEASTDAQLQRQFGVNVFGVMDVMRAVLPHYRQRKAGIFINVASMGGRLTTPYYATYHATKWAVDGFTEAMQFELMPLGIRVKIVEPGVINTEFQKGSADVAKQAGLTDYDAAWLPAEKRMMATGDKGTSPAVVAETIYRAATDGSKRLRYVVGSDAKLYLF